jgi:hypothetical protein
MNQGEECTVCSRIFACLTYQALSCDLLGHIRDKFGLVWRDPSQPLLLGLPCTRVAARFFQPQTTQTQRLASGIYVGRSRQPLSRGIFFLFS